MGLDSIIQTILSNLHLAGILALATMGITLIFKTSITTNFAQGMMATVGVFTASILSNKMGINLYFAIFVGILSSFIIGLLIDVVIIRNAKQINIIGKQMITMGLVIVISALLPIIYGTVPFEFARFFEGNLEFSFLSMDLYITRNGLFIVLVSTLILAIIFMALKFTKWGLGVRATASNEMVANMMGVNTRLITALSWSIAGALGATGAILMASQTGVVDANMMISVQVNGFMACILGGFSSFYGPIIGAILIPLTKGVIALYNSLWGSVILYSLILLVVLIKPVGLFGKKIAKKV